MDRGGRARRAVRVLGEGAAAGLVAGGLLGWWEIRLNDDLTHGMFRLAAHRLAGPMSWGAAGGMLLSAVLALGMAGLVRRGRGAAWAGAAWFGILWAGGLYAAAFPYRDLVFPLHRFSVSLLTRSIFVLVAAASALLLMRRVAGPLLHGTRFERPGGGVPGQDGTGSAGPGRAGQAAAWAALAAAALAFAVRPALTTPPEAKAGSRPSVILLSLDTLRADRMGVLGSNRPLTPLLDSLAREGTVFEQAMTPAPWTLPAHASLFASILPFDLRRHWDWNRVVPLRRALLAERFFEAGYRTAAFTGGGYVSARYGFGQGFEVYADHDEQAEGGPETIAAAALAWVRARGDRPFLLFLHTYEPHYPYTRPGFADPAAAGRLPPAISAREVDAMHRGVLVPTEGERRYVRDLYDGDVAHADRVFGGLLESLERDGILDRAVLVVFSDHGEELWDREPGYSPEHGHTLYQELVHVPLFVRWPGHVPAGARVRTPVSLIDLGPTLLDLAGLPADPAHRGRSLAEALRAGGEPEETPIFAESVQYGPERFMLRQGNLKVVLTPYPDRLENAVPIEARPLEVFDLAADPRETRDLPARLGADAAGMVDRLWRRAKGVMGAPAGPDEANPPLPEDLLRQLRSLGYVQ
jgi:arylsulfatase A-like enzyme